MTSTPSIWPMHMTTRSVCSSSAKALIGTNYDIDDLLAAARGRGDWLGRYGGWILALLLLALLLSAIHLMTLFTARPAHAAQP
jgi:hypothetical protein